MIQLPFLDNYPREIKRCPQTDFFTSVYSCFIHNSQKV